MNTTNAQIDIKGYNFLDFGCSAGGSLERYGRMFDAEGKGLGLDINPEKVRATLEKGYKATVCDITKLELSDKVSFGIMHHFLEHIPDMLDVEQIIRQACTVISDFLLIRQPYFDADPYLFSHGLKFFWSNWRGHPNHMTLLEFHNTLMPLVKDGSIKSFSLYGLYPVESSQDPTIHAIGSPIDQHDWASGEHPYKPDIEFTIPVFKETLAIIDLSGNATKKLEASLKPSKTFFSTI